MMHQQAVDDDVALRRYEYDDTVVFAGDLGPDGEGSVDVVEDTAIVVTADEQYDLTLPEGDSQVFIHNGVLTVEVTREPEEREE